MRVVETLALGGRRQLTLVVCGTERFLVGVSAESVDAIVLPTLPALPITLEAARNGTSVIAMSSLIRPFNLSGHPALSLPLPIAGSPLRAGLQIVGRKGVDELVCAIAACFEACFEDSFARWTETA